MTVRAQVAAVLAVLGLVGVVDFAKRVYVPRDDAERTTELKPAQPLDAPLSLAEARQRLQSWLPDQGMAAQASSGSNAEQADTNGANYPDRGELGGYVFLLRGIFDQDSGLPFAVMEVTPKTGGSTERREVVAGDSIHDVRVDRVAGRRVSLSTGNTAIELALFLAPEKETVVADKPND